jgi:hypothetical protein
MIDAKTIAKLGSGEPMTVADAIRASKRGMAWRWNRHSKREEFAIRTANGIRIVRSVTDPTVIRKLPPEQENTKGWTPYDPKEAA